MANNINAITSGVGGVSVTGDTSGAFAFQKDGTTVASISDTGVISSNVPAFNATLSANQSVTSGVATKVAFDTIEYDANSNFNTSTSIFTPTIAGYYQVNLAVRCQGASNPSVWLAFIYKNGSYVSFSGTQAASSNTTQYAQTSSIVYMNGTTDYLEAYGYIVATTPSFVTNVATTYFQACLIRAE